jgi:hypothetical protein
MIAQVFEKSRECEVLLGDKRRLVFQGASRLVPIETVKRLVSQSRKRVVVFKPNNDLQYAGVFLDADPNSRVLWVYRDYRDAINSSIKRWGNAHRDIMLGIARGRILHAGQAAIAEGVGETLLAELQDLCRDAPGLEDGAALLWYARNSLYYDLHLEDNRVRLVNYEATVRNPRKQFARMFEFAGVRFKHRYVRGVFGSSIGKEDPPELDERIEAKCRSLMRRLDASVGRDGPSGAGAAQVEPVHPPVRIRA